MTQACKFCGQQIQMVKNSEGKWMPENPDSSAHRCRNGQTSDKPVIKSQSTVQQDLKETGKMLPEAEARVRELAREEIVKFLTRALTG